MVQPSTPGVTPNRGMAPREALFVKLLWPLVCSCIRPKNLYDAERELLAIARFLVTARDVGAK